jgi:hypothetical protein
MIYSYFLLAFLLTVFIECTITFLMFKSKQFVYYIFLCNLLTNPALNLITLEVDLFFGVLWYKLALIILELVVVIVEARVIHSLCEFTVKRAILVSFVLNSVSFSFGLIICSLIIPSGLVL